MSKNKILFLGILVSVFVGTSIYAYSPRVRADIKLAECGLTHSSEQIECVFKVIESEMQRAGISAAMRIFSRAYNSYYSFASTGCHKYAHRMGDIAYFREYLGKKDLGEMDFPQETTACGYGFYHGFLEHVTQDNPSPEFVTETCAYLTNRLGITMGSIRGICYHGSGHGFMLAHVEKLSPSAWGDAWAFVGEPLSQCDMLPNAKGEDKSQCRQGVFNMLVEWMSIKQYSFSYDTENPFSTCQTMPERYWHDCYYETSQKLDNLSGRDPVRIAEIVRSAPTEDIRLLSFAIGVSGIIQQTIADGKGYEQTLERCVVLEDSLLTTCIRSILHGLFEHGAPQEEYKKAFEFCKDPRLETHGQTKSCYWHMADSFVRFYQPEKGLQLCAAFPQIYADLCTQRIEKGSSQQG